MLGKKLFELCYRPMHLFASINISYQCSPLTNINPPREKLPLAINEEYRDNHENPNDDTWWRFSPAAALLPIFYIASEKGKKISCFFRSFADKLEKNKLKNRVALVQYPANNPIEDRYHCQQLQNLEGYVAAVYDGHGAELAMGNLANILDDLLKQNKGKYTNEDELISECLKQAFDKVEDIFLQTARKAYATGFPKLVGACALVAVVHNNKLYVANAGDCKGVVCSVDDKGEVNYKKVSKTFNANSKKEQARLRQSFKDPDIYVCKESGACYVKGRLMPTRALGDFRLKHEEFNNPMDFGSDKGYSAKIANYNGPYITHQPDIKIFELTSSDRFMILSSDGMWDELKNNDVVSVVKENPTDKNKLTEELLKKSLSVVSDKTKLSESDLAHVPLGARRKIHDDMTIVVVDLRNQL